jgi:hypothetical protein
MTPRELELFANLIVYAVALDNANPDVGWGPSSKMIAQDLSKLFSFEVSEDDINKAVELSKVKY